MFSEVERSLKTSTQFRWQISIHTQSETASHLRLLARGHDRVAIPDRRQTRLQIQPGRSRQLDRRVVVVNFEDGARMHRIRFDDRRRKDLRTGGTYGLPLAIGSNIHWEPAVGGTIKHECTGRRKDTLSQNYAT